MENRIEISKYIWVITFLTFIACSNHAQEVNMGPLMTVINLKSAESVGDFENAKNYIDVQEVYAQYADSKSPEEEWKQMVNFFTTLSQDNKFTNCFKYYKYNITEVIEENKANVIFESKNKQSQLKKITYSLKKRNEFWIVTGITFDKN